MALGFALKVVLSVVTGTAVIAPVSYLAANGTFSSSQSLTLENGEKCWYFPIKGGEVEKKLYACKKPDDSKAIFKWWTKDGTGEKGMQEIKTLSWKQKSPETDGFELEVTLNGEAQDTKIIQEDGNDSFVASSPIENMETNCSFKDTWSNGFELLCQKTGSTGTKQHQILVYG